MGRKCSAFWLFGFTMLHLIILQLKAFLNYDLDLKIETCYMFTLCKFNILAFNYEDGGKKEEELKCSFFRET